MTSAPPAQDCTWEREPVPSTRLVPGNTNMHEHFTASTQNLQN
jgi:hypothetical protein